MPINFLNNELHDSNFRKGVFIDMYDEPTYLTFSIDFDFYDELTSIDGKLDLFRKSPLFIEKSSQSESSYIYGCSEYLKNRGMVQEANDIIKFKNILKYITEQTPWYFQSISGLNKMWENAISENAGYKAKDIKLNINTLEAVDLRITNLASLYRNAVYDTVNMRQKVPDNMRWFKMDIYISEFRNLRNTLEPLLNIGGLTAGNFGSVGGILGAGNGNINSNYGNVLANFGYIKFTCYQCEFDFSNSIPVGDSVSIGGTDISPNNNSFGIKVGYYEESESFNFNEFDESQFNLDNIVNKLNGIPIVGDKLSSLSSNALNNVQNILNTPNRIINNAASELQKMIENGSFGSVSEYGYKFNGKKIPSNTAVPKNKNAKSL